MIDEDARNEFLLNLWDKNLLGSLVFCDTVTDETRLHNLQNYEHDPRPVTVGESRLQEEELDVQVF